jgi:hypothetical protein
VSSTRSAFEQFHELFDRQSRIGYDASQRAGSDMLVIRHDDTGMWIVATKDHVTACLPSEHETRALQRSANLPAG